MASKPSSLRPPSKLVKPSAGIPRPTSASGTSPKSDDLSRSSSPSMSSGVLTENTDDFIVGNRVWVGGTKPGMIQYIGETQFAPGEWAGVVLDELIGKNDGSVAGVKYFQCEPKRGVFSRLTKLSREPIPGLMKAEGSTDDISSVKANGSIRSASPRPSTPLRTARSLTPSSLKGSDTGAAGQLRLGDRVQVTTSSGVKTGTLRHLGSTEFAAGEWAGVELDEPTGKNDGSVADKRYFECPLKYGLFAPISKVTKQGSTPMRRTAVPPVPLASARRVGAASKLTGSHESVSTIGSTSSAARATKPRLGVNSLTSSNTPSRTSATSITATHTAMQGALKEKEQHIEQLLKERDLERSEVARAASKVEDAERELASMKAEFQRFKEDSEQTVLKLREISESSERQKRDLEFQLEEERKKTEDLQFRVEEESILKGDLERCRQTVDSMKEADVQRIKELEELYAAEKSHVELLEQESNANFQNEETVAKHLDEIESLQKKLNEKDKALTAVLLTRAEGESKSSELEEELIRKEAKLVQLEALRVASESHEAELNGQIKKLEEMLQDGQQNLGSQEGIISDLKVKLMGSEQSLAEIQRQVALLEISCSDLRRKTQGAEERCEQLSQQKIKLECDIADTMKSSGDSSSHLSQMNNELREKEKLIEGLQLDFQTSVQERQKLDDILAHLKRQQLKDAEALKEKHQQECCQMEEKLRCIQEESDKAKERLLEELAEKSRDLSSVNTSKEAELLNLRMALKESEQRESALAAQLSGAQKRYDESAKHVEGVQEVTEKKLMEAMNEVNNLKKEKHEGVSKCASLESSKAHLESQVELLQRKKQEQAGAVNDRDKKLLLLNSEVDRLKADFNNYKGELQRKLAENELDQNTFQNMRNMTEIQQKTIEELQQLLKKTEEEKEQLEKGSSDQVRTLLEQTSQFESRIVSYESKYEEAQHMQSQLIINFENEKETLQKVVESSQSLLEQKVKETAQYQSEMLQLKQEAVATSALRVQMEQLKQENSKMKLDKETLENHVKLLDNQLSQSSISESSTDPTIQKLLEEKDACEAQIDFLNSVIVDMQKKNDDLQSRIQLLEVGDLLNDSSDVNLNDIKKPLVAPRLFCDICEVFDLHDTEDCPRQESFDDPQPTKNHGSRHQARPYCETCEIFGHWTNECDDNETF